MHPFVSMLAVDIESVAVKVRVGLSILYCNNGDCNESGGDECSECEWVVTAVWMAGAAAAVTSGQACGDRSGAWRRETTTRPPAPTREQRGGEGHLQPVSAAPAAARIPRPADEDSQLRARMALLPDPPFRSGLNQSSFHKRDSNLL